MENRNVAPGALGLFVCLFVRMPVFELHKWKYAIKQAKATNQRNL